MTGVPADRSSSVGRLSGAKDLLSALARSPTSPFCEVEKQTFIPGCIDLLHEKGDISNLQQA